MATDKALTFSDRVVEETKLDKLRVTSQLIEHLTQALAIARGNFRQERSHIELYSLCERCCDHYRVTKTKNFLCDNCQPDSLG
jgi:hypothetical protein